LIATANLRAGPVASAARAGPCNGGGQQIQRRVPVAIPARPIALSGTRKYRRRTTRSILTHASRTHFTGIPAAGDRAASKGIPRLAAEQFTPHDVNARTSPALTDDLDG
jgi:hypothetical protein